MSGEALNVGAVRVSSQYGQTRWFDTFGRLFSWATDNAYRGLAERKAILKQQERFSYTDVHKLAEDFHALPWDKIRNVVVTYPSSVIEITEKETKKVNRRKLDCFEGGNMMRILVAELRSNVFEAALTMEEPYSIEMNVRSPFLQ